MAQGMAHGMVLVKVIEQVTVVSKKSCILTWKTLCGSFKRQEEEKRFEGNKGYQKQATSNAYLHQNAAAIQ
ncbi:hypothetical protein Tco_0826424, partial [Tanacetum coccineum]